MPNLTFWEKWNGIAQSKGFTDLDNMMKSLQEKYTNKQMAEFLEVSTRTIELIWVRLHNASGSTTKKKLVRDGDGFSKTDVKEKWGKLLEERGFKTLREAAAFYKENKWSIERMARDFSVTTKALQKRLESAGIILPKEEAAVKTLNPLGLL